MTNLNLIAVACNYTLSYNGSGEQSSQAVIEDAPAFLNIELLHALSLLILCDEDFGSLQSEYMDYSIVDLLQQIDDGVLHGTVDGSTFTFDSTEVLSDDVAQAYKITRKVIDCAPFMSANAVMIETLELLKRSDDCSDEEILQAQDDTSYGIQVIIQYLMKLKDENIEWSEDQFEALNNFVPK